MIGKLHVAEVWRFHCEETVEAERAQIVPKQIFQTKLCCAQLEVLVTEGEEDEDVLEALDEILVPEPGFSAAQQQQQGTSQHPDQWQQQQQPGHWQQTGQQGQQQQQQGQQQPPPQQQQQRQQAAQWQDGGDAMGGFGDLPDVGSPQQRVSDMGAAQDDSVSSSGSDFCA